MKTILQALRDEVHYPLSVGFVENKLLARGLDSSEELEPEVLQSAEFKGATADCLISLILAPNVSEAGISVSLPERDKILKWANNIYREIGENEVSLTNQPKVKFL